MREYYQKATSDKYNKVHDLPQMYASHPKGGVEGLCHDGGYHEQRPHE